MRQRWLSISALALLVAAVWVGNVAAQGGGDRIVGTVVNGTPGGTLPVGVPVTLQFFSEGAWTQVYTSTLATDGSFRFEGLSAETGSDFLISLTHQDVAYFSQPATLEDRETVVDITIFEPTEDISGVQVDQAHLFIVPLGDRIQVAEYYLVGSSAERAYVGTQKTGQDRRTTLSFTVPSGATSLGFEDKGLGERFLGDASAFADTMPILPGTGTTEVSFSYELAYSVGMEIARVVDVLTKSVVIIVNGTEVGIEGSGVIFAGVIDTQMGKAASYTAGPLEPGSPLVVRFVPQTNAATSMQEGGDGAPAGRAPQERNPAVEAAVGALVFVGAGVGVYQLWHRRSRPTLPESARETILALAALDRRHAEGAMDEDQYTREREGLMRKARAVLKR
ncbi:MAG: hypothetical protein MUF84_02285 [Anaerolineae bacterium]|nr:hypothetical protein [Anaerolineae bacterium]